MNWIKNKISHFYHVLNRKKLFQFGALMILFLGALCFFKDEPYRWYFLGAAIFQLVGFMFPVLFRIQFTVLSIITYPIGTVMSFVLLGVIYYGVVTFVGFFRPRGFDSKWKESVKEINPEKMFE